MDSHRLVSPTKVDPFPFDRPFSSFAFIEKHFNRSPAIQRLFSLGRSEVAKTLLVENIPPTGLISEENEEIRGYFQDYVMSGLQRISFWRQEFSNLEKNAFTEKNCIGYAILKRDTVASINHDRWHVFEAVFKKYPHEHNCVPNPMDYKVQLGNIRLNVSGLLYAQQNQLNKACAQVALRSLISRAIKKDISYKTINDIARKVATLNPGEGLNIDQIREVLKAFNIRYSDYEYQEGMTLNERKLIPYDKYVYAGIESGLGALVGFKFAGPSAQKNAKHIIPFYGHTFNKDTWAPEADKDYFHIGDHLGYLPSDNWTSSFLGHDDNFGPNLCVPRLFISQQQVEYVVELLRPQIAYNGAQAQALALKYLYSVLSQLSPQLIETNEWLPRLIDSYNAQRIVLRAIAVDRDTYISHLSNGRDWKENSENPIMTGILTKCLPKTIWVVEVSLPQLFPANKSKLGEIILHGELPIKADLNYRSHFVLVRLPGYYFLDQSENGGDRFLSAPSLLKSHVPALRLG